MMKTLALTALFSGVVLLPVAATVVSTGVMPYPVNLGPASDPGRIPVGLIPCESNHGYGLLPLIATQFPSIPGGWKWDGGVELNGNLPSAFGISIESGGAIGAAHEPVEIHVDKQSPPAYSPYTKEQVLLATLRCLLDSVRATPKQPLQVKVITQAPGDEALRRFSGQYFTHPTEEGDEFQETVLPGCVSQVNRDGIREIVFENAAGQNPAAPARPQPMWMPFPIEGDIDEELLLVPVWTGNGLGEDRLALLGNPWPLVQDCFNPAIGNPDANILTRRQLIHSFAVERSKDKASLRATMHLTDDRDPTDGMALLCWAAVLSELPTAQTPLEVTLRMNKELDPRFQSWVTDSGWEEVALSSDVAIRTTFVWDPVTGALTKGNIPKLRVDRLADGSWEVTNREAYQHALKHAAEQGDDLP